MARPAFNLLNSRALLGALALGLAAGCAPGGPVTYSDLDLAWSPSASLPTAGTVSWTATAATEDGAIEYGTTTEYGDRAEAVEAGDVELLGLVPDTTYHYRATGDGWVSPDLTFVTGSAPDTLETLDLAESDDADWGRYVLTTVFTNGNGGQVQILDRALNPVWWSVSPVDFVWTAKLAADHMSVLYLAGGGDLDAELVRVGMDGEVIERIPAPYAHHDFVELPDGSLAWIASTVRTWEGWELVGDQIVVRATDGTTRVVWDAFDHLTPVEQSHWDSDLSPLGSDWTHCNGLDYDAATGTFLLSSYYLRSIYRIDATTGDLLWTLGGDESDFTFPDDRGFGPQHSPVVTEDGVLLFDNGQSSTGSRVVEYALDGDAGAATRTAEYPHPSGAWVGTFADASRLPSGQVTSTWAERGEAIVFDEGGAVSWHAQAAPGAMIFGMQVVDSLYE